MSLANYEWPRPHGFEPFNHQKETAQFLITNRKAFCFNEQGTGKTASVIWAVDYLMQRSIVKRVLVICPLSIMKSAWQQDLFKFAIHRTVAVAHGSRAKRKEIINAGAEFVIINFDGVEIVKNEIINGGFDLIVVDEASAYKNAQTTRWKTLRDINKVVKGLWMLTGTPAAQSPLDAYGLAKLINPTSIPMFHGQYRDMVMQQITKFKWVPKPTAKNTVHSILQPAIRFVKKDCIDLPPLTFIDRDAPLTPQQAKYYAILKKEMLLEAAGEEVSAVNAATKMSKLLQISCIAYNTPVLTQLGWMPICNVMPDDYVWDGEFWVRCEGAVFKGMRQTMVLDGVTLTPEHLVLTDSGWQPAEECVNGYASKRFGRTEVRLPDGLGESWDIERENEESDVALPMRLRGRSGTGIPELALYSSPKPKALWVPSRDPAENPRFIDDATVQHLGGDASQMFEPKRQGLQKLRSTWYHCLQTLGGVVREFLGGHAGWVHKQTDIGQKGCQQGVHQSELSMGNSARAEQQHACEQSVGNSEGLYDCGAGRTGLRIRKKHLAGATDTLRLAATRSINSEGETAVFDLVNCGPRNRFVVRGDNGEHLIVHNCGSVYTDTHEVLEFDVSNRMNVVQEVIDESSNKVLVFVPFTHTIEMLKNHLTKNNITCDVINGAVPVNRRSQIVTDFQTQPTTKVLIIQPQAASHGLTLTAADTIIWYAPCTSVETYLQANARIDRPGQVNPMTIVHICGSQTERRVYSMLRGNVTNHQQIIDLYRQEISSTEVDNV